MLITPANLELFFTGLKNIFWQNYNAAPVFYDKVATEIPSSTEQQAYGWIGMVESMREWVGPRKVNTPAPQNYILKNQLFEQTNSIDRFKLEDDSFGIYNPIVEFMALQAKKLPDYQLVDLLLNTGAQTGSKQIGLDGLTHWNTAHPVDLYDSSKGTYSNDFTGGGMSVGGITVGGALNNVSYATVRQEMMSRKGENNKALGIMPNILMVPPQLDVVARTILHAQFIAPQTLAGSPGTNVGATENMLQGTADLITVAELGSVGTTWYLFDTTKPIKPFIWQLRQAPEFVYRITPQDPVVFDTHAYVYGTSARGAIGYSQAWLSSRSGA